MSIELSLAVQYGTPADELPRWRLRRWVRHALDTLARTPGPHCRALRLTLRLADERETRELNHSYRERDYATNVLTFEYGEDPEGVTAADVVLCVPVLRREAAEQQKPLLHHAAHLTVHGVLHALGHDHIETADAHRMETLETAILEKLGIPDPYRVS